MNNYKIKKNIGDVFLINDKTLGSPIPKFPRRVVVINEYNNKDVELLKLLPSKKGYFRMDVSKFDGKHNLDLKFNRYNYDTSTLRKLNILDLYEKFYVYGTDNDFLTFEEKEILGIN